MSEVTRYLNNMNGLENEVRVRLLNHMANRANNNELLNSNSSMNTPTVTAHVKPLQHYSSPSSPEPTNTPCSSPCVAADINNNNVTMANANQTPILVQTNDGGQMQIINKLPLISGQFGQGNVAFVIPADSLQSSNGQLSGFVLPVQLNNSPQTPLKNETENLSRVSQVETAPKLIVSPTTLNTNNNNARVSPLNLSVHQEDTKTSEYPASIKCFQSQPYIKTERSTTRPILASVGPTRRQRLSPIRRSVSPKAADLSCHKIAWNGDVKMEYRPNPINPIVMDPRDPMWRPW